MERYHTLMQINRKEIVAEDISDTEKEKAISVLLHGACIRRELLGYPKRIGAGSKTNPRYPHYYLPPDNGKKKPRLVQGYLPKTQLLYANYFELEILRLLCMLASGNEAVDAMVEGTLQRLKSTCFGSFCPQGNARW